jgi:6-phosphofructokinase
MSSSASPRASATTVVVLSANIQAQVDTFGHKMLAGCGKILENYVRNQFGVKVRSVELNVNQRCSGLTVSGTDLNEAEMAGRFGVQAALDGHTGQMVAFELLLNLFMQLLPFQTLRT